jgi:WD40 repeat protein
MEFSPDSKRLAAVEAKSSSTTRKMLHVLFDLLSKSPRRRSGYHDQRIKILDVPTGKEIASIRVSEVDCLVFSPDGKMLAVGENYTFRRRFVYVWDLSGIAPRQTTRLWWDGDLDNNLSSLAFSPDGKSLATADENVKLWELRTEKVLRTFQKKTGRRTKIRQVAFSPNGKFLAWAASTDIPFFLMKGLAGEVCLGDVATGRKVLTVDQGSFLIRGLAFSQNGKILTFRTFTPDAKGTDFRVQEKVWDVTQANGPVLRRRRALKVGDLAFVSLWKKAQSGHLVALLGGVPTSDGKNWISFLLMDAVTGKTLATVKAKTSDIVELALSPDGKILATGGKEIKLWNVAELIKFK